MQKELGWRPDLASPAEPSKGSAFWTDWNCWREGRKRLKFARNSGKVKWFMLL